MKLSFNTARVATLFDRSPRTIRRWCARHARGEMNIFGRADKFKGRWRIRPPFQVLSRTITLPGQRDYYEEIPITLGRSELGKIWTFVDRILLQPIEVVVRIFDEQAYRHWLHSPPGEDSPYAFSIRLLSEKGERSVLTHRCDLSDWGHDRHVLRPGEEQPLRPFRTPSFEIGMTVREVQYAVEEAGGPFSKLVLQVTVHWFPMEVPA